VLQREGGEGVSGSQLICRPGSYAPAMPSSASRSRATPRRSPRPAPRTVAAPPPERPLAVPFAAFFGVLLAAEAAYFAWLFRTPDVAWDWFVAAPLLLAGLAAIGAVLVFTVRARGWIVLALAAFVSLVGLLLVAGFFAVLGGGPAVWSTLLLLVGPLACLVLALQRPVREWTRTRRPQEGRRTAGPAR
jgi:peptidoglycan/LPS O-acetylase OafA/YrhL